MSEMRKLGKSEIEVAPMMLGGNVFGWTIDEEISFKILDAYIDSGLNFIDTADVYSRWKEGNEGGDSEEILGNWMQSRGNRDKVILATKLGMEMGPDMKGLSAEYIVSAVEASLTRLKSTYIDLYQAHRDDTDTPLDETLKAFDKLIQHGKVRVIGASNYSGERLTEALAVSKANVLTRYESLQPHYNLYDREDYETNLEKVIIENQVGVIPYFSLAKGFLTGKYRSEDDLSKSPRGGGVKMYLNDRGYAILAALDNLAAKYETTQGQVALAWLIARPGITAPIASATNLDQLAELVSAVNLELDADSIAQLNTASAY